MASENFTTCLFPALFSQCGSDLGGYQAGLPLLHVCMHEVTLSTLSGGVMNQSSNLSKGRHHHSQKVTASQMVGKFGSQKTVLDITVSV